MWILFLLLIGLAALFFIFCKLTSYDSLVDLQCSSWLVKLVYILIIGVIAIGIYFIFSKITTKFVMPIMDNIYFTMNDLGEDALEMVDDEFTIIGKEKVDSFFKKETSFVIESEDGTRYNLSFPNSSDLDIYVVGDRVHCTFKNYKIADMIKDCTVELISTDKAQQAITKEAEPVQQEEKSSGTNCKEENSNRIDLFSPWKPAK